MAPDDIVQRNIDKLTAAWLAEGHKFPLMWSLEETVEKVQFAATLGIDIYELVDVMRVLVEQIERSNADIKAFGKPRLG